MADVSHRSISLNELARFGRPRERDRLSDPEARMYLSGLAGAVRGGDQDLLVRGSLDLEHGARSEIADAIDGSPQDVLGIRDVSVDVNEHRLRTQTDQGTPARLQLAAFAQDHVEPGIRLEHRATFHARRTRHDALEQVRLAD